MFEHLSPHLVIQAVESAMDLALDGSIWPFTSYVNRVYGLKDQEGASWVAKFFRPGRWTLEQLEEEQQMLLDCQASEVPVVLPQANREGRTLHPLQLDTQETGYFSVYPLRSGRTFDATADGDWLRLGALVGRMHLATVRRPARTRLVCHPAASTTVYLQELWDKELVHRDLRNEFFDLAEHMLDRCTPLFEDLPLRRIHGDCHRGNVLDRGPEGLLLVDFDDMMQGPAIQDLWLMLPDRLEECGREYALLEEGYQQFLPLDPRQPGLVEALRFMRMVHFLAWCARQTQDLGFDSRFPGWGSRSFWVKEIEDFHSQSLAMDKRGF